MTVPETKKVLEICQSAANGDDDARRKLMELLFDRIHRTASYLADNLEEAEDLAQAACMEVLAYIGTFRGESSLNYWADRVTMFTASKVLSKKARRQRILDNTYQPPGQAQAVDELAEQTEIRSRLARLLRKLKYSHREVLLLRYVDGYTITEAASLCGIPVETARGRVKKGRAILKRKVMTDPLLKEWIEEWVQ
ncbi:MAG: sigma-70 family RNA polymerase sigma factor [Deltaproteobacteria bacterium]|nr:sigma-70 family RNA polymerase sigma factor [Deltaproteobacteria bacterium]